MLKSIVITLMVTSGGVEMPVDTWKPTSAEEFAIQYNQCKDAAAKADNVRYVGLYGVKVSNGLSPRCTVEQK